MAHLLQRLSEGDFSILYIPLVIININYRINYRSDGLRRFM
jgi:hypothetical protein